MELLKALKPIEDMEAGLAELYHRYSNLLAQDPEAGTFFEELSRDEKNHQQVAQYQRRLTKRNPKVFSAVNLDVDFVEHAVKSIALLINGTAPATLEEMIRITLDCENSTAEYYDRCAKMESNAEVVKVMLSLGLASSDHLKVVQKFAKKRGFNPAPPSKGLLEISKG